MKTYGWTPGTFVAQKAPGRLPSRGGASIQLLAEEALDDVARLGREVRERVQHELGRVRPAHVGRVVCERRHAVVERQPVEPEEASLERVVALDDVVAIHDRVDERLHGLVGGVVRKVARRDPCPVSAKTVVDRLVDGNRVEDERARAQTRSRERPSRPPRHAAARLDPVSRASPSPPRSRPRSPSRSTLIAPRSSSYRRSQALNPETDFSVTIFSSGSVRMCGRNFRTVCSQCRQLSSSSLARSASACSSVERRELEPEEEELRVDRGTLLRQPGHERAALRVGHVRREPEVRVVDRARERRLDPLALLDRLSQLAGAELRDMPVVPLTELGCRLLGLLDVVRDAWVVACRRRGRRYPRRLPPNP